MDLKDLLQKLSEIRGGLHSSVITLVMEACDTRHALVKPPLTDPCHTCPGKIVGIIDSIEEAGQLAREIKKRIDSTNAELVSLIEEYAEERIRFHPIRYKISVVHCQEEVWISMRQAKECKSHTGGELIRKIQKSISHLYIELEAQIETSRIKNILASISRLKEIMPIIHPEKIYTVVKRSGIDYRVSWFDASLKMHKQKSVGNVFILVDDRNAHFSSPSPRKKRSDEAIPLAENLLLLKESKLEEPPTFYKASIYPFDMRYVQRRHKRLATNSTSPL